MTALAGTRALITGAAGGIGSATARAFVDAGARVVVSDVDAGIADVGHELDCPALTVDLTDRPAVDGLLDAATRALGGAPTAIVHTAGVLFDGRIGDVGDDDWDRLLAVNLTATMAILRAADRVLSGPGSITVVSSNAAATPRIGLGAYGASKAAVTALVRSVGLELAPRAIRCNVISPGSTDTPMLRGMWSAESSVDSSSIDQAAAAVIAGSPDQFRLGIPLGRLATADDIAGTAVFLASDAARHITMHDLRVDGGATLDQ
ncbi:SDR family oxidoreductase [Gordonia asplenii]|uniref:SDR family oxidoreductase n=1 Tax=Gordonia asplenii TaxID=2725283 RepID=UPI0028AC5D53|nr:SDR family oxidoreductase [Gordonia asplenii]